MAIGKVAVDSSTLTSAWYVVDSLDRSNGPISLGVSGSGFSGGPTVQYTFEDPFFDGDGNPYSSAPTLGSFDHSVLASMTGAATGQIDGLVSAVRIATSAISSAGTLTLFIGQGSMG